MRQYDLKINTKEMLNISENDIQKMLGLSRFLLREADFFHTKLDIACSILDSMEVFLGL